MEGWRETCRILRDEYLTYAWNKALNSCLELSISDLPPGRSWNIKISNFDDDHTKQEFVQAIQDCVALAATRLGQDIAKAAGEEKPVNVNVLDTCLVIFDRLNKPLYHYNPPRSRSMISGSEKWDYPEDEGFTALFGLVTRSFFNETMGLDAFLTLLGTSPDLSNTLENMEAGCQGMKKMPQSSLIAKNLLKETIEELMKFAEPEINYQRYEIRETPTEESLPMTTWKKIALNCFHSDKLRLRRAGLEQLGEICKVLVYHQSHSKKSITNWLHEERVLESTFLERPDDRVVPCCEELFIHAVELNMQIIKMFLARSESVAVQKLLGNICLHSAFDEGITFQLLDGAARMVLNEGHAGAVSLILAALSHNKQTRTSLIYKGKRCTLAVIQALLSVLLVWKNTVEEESQLIEALTQVIMDQSGRVHRRYAIDMLISSLLPSSEMVPTQVKVRMEETEYTYGNLFVEEDPSTDVAKLLTEDEKKAKRFPSLIRPDVNREAAHRAIRRLLASFAQTPIYSYNSGEHSTRLDVLRWIEEEWSFREVWFVDFSHHATDGRSIEPRLELLGFFMRFSSNSHSFITSTELEKIWEIVKQKDAIEVFAFWLCCCAHSSCNPCISTACIKDVLENFWTKEELKQGGERTYMCMQTLFLQMNISSLVSTQEQESGSIPFFTAAPSTEKSGSRLIGRRISVLHQDGSMQIGSITSYKESLGKHTIEYYTGTIEEKSLDSFKEWWLLPSSADSKAGGVTLKQVRGNIEFLTGLDNIWVLALEAENESVSERAKSLLVSLHRKSNSESFIEKAYKILRDAVEARPSRDRNAGRCIELLKSLDVYSRAAVPKEIPRLVSHGHKGYSLPVEVTVDSNRPDTASSSAALYESAASQSTVTCQTNTRLDDFVKLVCRASEADVSSSQVSIDPQNEFGCGGLGVPVAMEEVGTDCCIVEEVGLLPGMLCRVTLGTKQLPNSSSNNSLQLEGNALAIVPYLESPVNSLNTMSVEESSLSSSPPPPGALSGGGESSSQLKASPTPTDDEGMDNNNLSMSPTFYYPLHQYDVLFGILNNDAVAPNVKALTWEFLQSIPTCAEDEGALSVAMESCVQPSLWRTLYRFQLLETSQKFLPILPQLLEIMRTLKSSTLLFSVVIPSLSSVLRWVAQHVMTSDVCDQISELLICSKELLKAQAVAPPTHTCVSVIPPLARLCDECLTTRRLIRASFVLLEAFESIIKSNAAVANAYFTSAAQSKDLVWDILVDHPAANVREKMKLMLRNMESKFIVHSLILCEQRLETMVRQHQPTTTTAYAQSKFNLDSFFSLLAEQLAVTKDAQAMLVFSQVSQLVLTWRHDDIVQDSFEESLLISFVQLLASLTPHLSIPTAEASRIVKLCLEKFLMNTSQPRILLSGVRKSIASFVRVLVATSLQFNQRVEILREMDEFLQKTPVPLRRQEKGWAFEIDWSVDPGSADGGGLRLRQDSGQVGLLNRGFTCYVNSIIQMLFAIQPFRNLVLNAPIPPPPLSLERSTSASSSSSSLVNSIAPPVPAPVAPPPPPPAQDQPPVLRGGVAVLV